MNKYHVKGMEMAVGWGLCSECTDFLSPLTALKTQVEIPLLQLS